MAINEQAQDIPSAAVCHFVVDLHLLSTQSGGRQSGIASGYRPQIFIDGDDVGATLTFDSQWMQPGESRQVFGTFFRPENCNKLAIGKTILVREGAKTVGYGVIVWRAGQSDLLAGLAESDVNNASEPL